MDTKDLISETGTYGKVYRSKINGEYVAIKTYKGEPDWKEIEIMKHYQHPNIMGLKSVLEEGKSIVMEHGFTVYKPSEKMIQDLCLGLYFLHSKGILHLDLKFDNFVVVNDVSKLIDFGAAFIGTKNMIKKGVIVSFATTTYLHASPEQTRSMMDYGYSTVSDKSDVFALGVTFLEMFNRQFNSVVGNKHPLFDMEKIMEDNKLDDWDNEDHIEGPYYVQKTYFENPETRYKLIEKTINSRNIPNKKLYIDLIFKMTEFNPQDRPSMKEVLKILNLKPVKGSFSTFIPSSSRHLNSKQLTNLIEFFSTFKIDCYYIFACIDTIIRRHMTGKTDAAGGIFMTLEMSGKIEDNVWVDEGLPFFVHRGIKTKDQDYLDLNCSTLSCNLIYRFSNNLDDLATNLKKLISGEIDYRTTDFYKLSKGPKTDKTMNFDVFYKKYFTT